MIETLGKVWALFTPSDRRKALAMAGLVILLALTETVGVVSIMPFLAALGGSEETLEAAWMLWLQQALGLESRNALIAALGLASIGIVTLSSAFKTVALHLVNRFVHLQRHSLSSRLLSRYLHQPYEFFLMRNPSEMGKNVLSEVDQLVFELLQPLSMLIAQGAVVLAMMALIVAFDPQMALAIIAAVGLLYAVIYLAVRRRLSRTGRERQIANAGRYQACNEALGGIKDVKVMHTADTWLATFNHHSRQYSRHTASAETLSTSPLYIVEATGYSGLILIALFLLMRGDDVTHVLPALGLYGFAAYRLLPAAQVMYRGFARLRFSAAALDNICRDLSLAEEQTMPAASVLRPMREIRLRGIRYAYPSAPDKPVLRDLDLVIPANTSLGIAGRSGAGKSTLMDILLGLLRPDAGSLSIDGEPVSASNIGAWQRAIGYVPQHIYLADASVAENIAFGVPHDQIDMQAIERAARAAQIHDFVAGDLPLGYATRVGDRGIRLSGGQRQRIGIARALYRDPPVLLMDEATSALDSETEEAVNVAIRSLSGHKTVVVIAHREASLRSCDRVVRLDAPAEAIGTSARDGLA